MAHTTDHLKREIEALEQQLSAQQFGGIVDRKRRDQLEDKLRKKRKELARILSAEDSDDLDAADPHVDIPGLISGIESTPDMGPDFPLDLDVDDGPVKLGASKKSAGKPAAKSPAKSPAKTAVKSTTKKPASKPKGAVKAKPAQKKKAVTKPAKKKSKR